MFVSDQLRRLPHGGVRVGDAHPAEDSRAIKTPHLAGRDWCEVVLPGYL